MIDKLKENEHWYYHEADYTNFVSRKSRSRIDVDYTAVGISKTKFINTILSFQNTTFGRAWIMQRVTKGGNEELLHISKQHHGHVVATNNKKVLKILKDI